MTLRAELDVPKLVDEIRKLVTIDRIVRHSAQRLASGHRDARRGDVEPNPIPRARIPVLELRKLLAQDSNGGRECREHHVYRANAATPTRQADGAANGS